MIIKSKIEGVCSDDKTRVVITQPYFDGKSIIATNGHIMAVIPAESYGVEDGEDRGFIPLSAIREAKKGKKNQKGALFCNGSVKVIHSGAEYPREDLGKFPDCMRILNDSTGRKNTFTVSINADLLKALADALNPTDGRTNGVRLTFDLGNNVAPIHVKGPLGDGVLMPLRQ